MKENLLIGTYTKDMGQGFTGAWGEGLYHYLFDESSASLPFIDVYREYENPSYFDAKDGLLYIAQELPDAAKVSVMRQDGKSGRYVHQVTKAFRGSGSCHVSVWPEGDYLSVSNYNSGSLLVLGLDQNGLLDGTVCDFQDQGRGADPDRQEGPHVHSTAISPDGTLLLAADLGIDALKCYRKSGGGVIALESKDLLTPPGEGPRHMCFRPDGRTLYLATELGNHVLRYECNPEDGTLLLGQRISTRQDGALTANTAADIHLSKDGRFLYASNRGDDSIAIYSVEEKDGQLAMVGIQACGGKTPRSFCISQSGAYLLVANQDSDNVTVFRRNGESGLLEEKVGELAIHKPVCIKLL